MRISRLRGYWQVVAIKPEAANRLPDPLHPHAVFVKGEASQRQVLVALSEL